MSGRRDVWDQLRESFFEVALGVMLLSVVYGWDLWPRWMLVGMGWIAVVFGGLTVLVNGIWLMLSERP